MKKRCTNSRCRKLFSAEIHNGWCPYCGKHYSGFTATDPDVIPTWMWNDYYSRHKQTRRHKKSWRRRPVEDLRLYVTSSLYLRRAHINTIGELVDMTESDLTSIFQSFGVSPADRVHQIVSRLSVCRLSLKADPYDYDVDYYYDYDVDYYNDDESDL